MPNRPAGDAGASYETLYRRGERLFGPPLPKVVRFFSEQAPRRARVLDLGCGQGRHALLAARLGHTVTGVDVSATGVAQLQTDATQAGLRVRGVVSDVFAYRPRGAFDVVLLIRVLCHLDGDDGRARLLHRLPRLVRVGGFVLIAARAASRRVVAAFFSENSGLWSVDARTADWICARRIEPRVPGP